MNDKEKVIRKLIEERESTIFRLMIAQDCANVRESISVLRSDISLMFSIIKYLK